MKITKKLIIVTLIIFIQIIIIGLYGILYYKVNAEADLISEGTIEDSLELIKLKQQSASATTIPAQYDLRYNNPYGFNNHGNIVITVENQVGGTCWDFASMMSLQTSLAKKNNSSSYSVLSKAHIDYLASKYSGKKYGSGREIGEGGGFGTVLRYFKNNDGPILNSKCFYASYNNEYQNERVYISGTTYYNDTAAKKTTAAGLMDKIQPDYYVHEVTNFPGVRIEGPSATGTLGTKKMYYVNNGQAVSENEMKELRNTIKQHIITNGGLYCSIRTHHYFIGDNLGAPYNTYDGKYSQYDDGSIKGGVEVDGETTGGHAITIIGWDDNYSRSKFNAKNSKGEIVHPTSNGAWLIVNNYGSGAFESGCQWVSYEDYNVQADIHGYLSVNTTKKEYTYEFEGTKAYNRLKSLCTDPEEGVTCTDERKTIVGVDLIFNDMKVFNFNSTDLSTADLNTLLKYNLPKLTTFSATGNNISNVSIFSNISTIKTLDLSYNNISDVTPLPLTQYDSIDLKGQEITKRLNVGETECSYPSIFLEAKKSNSVLYSKDGFTFSGCNEKADGKGVILTSNTATITINSGEAFGTQMTITRPADESPTIKMYNATSGTQYAAGSRIEKNTRVRFVFSDDVQISGYNITNSATAPTTWLTTYDQTQLEGKVRIVSKALSTVGTNYIWVKDSTGHTVKTTLNVYLLGDVDGNGTVNITDVLKLRRYIANSSKWNLSDIEKTRADVNQDGQWNVTDVLKLRRYIAASSNSSIANKHHDWLW